MIQVLAIRLHDLYIYMNQSKQLDFSYTFTWSKP